MDDLPVWSVPCFYVRSSHRGRGVMEIAAAFPRHGFQVVARRKPDRPVLRKVLGPG